MMEEMKNEQFLLKLDGEKRPVFLGNVKDEAGMNWIEGKKIWGTMIAPEGILTSSERHFTERGTLRETYRFKNTTDFPVFFQKTDAGIYTTFNDNYEDTRVCMKQKCHTHIFCGGAASYVMALQMGNQAPHLGMKVLKGSIAGYSVERDLTKESNDRGDFILHPELPVLHSGETAEIVFELFWFQNRQDFHKKLLDTLGFPDIKVQQCTYFKGETVRFRVYVREGDFSGNVRISCRGKESACIRTRSGDVSVYHCEFQADETGEMHFTITSGGRVSYVRLKIVESLQKLLYSRCHFIAEKQQFHGKGSVLDGAYLIYDNEEEKKYYGHLDDHNGGRERIGMGILMAGYLQVHFDEDLNRSLDKYVQYVYRELYDRASGIVYNDVKRNLDWNRLYNYPWMAVFQMELYKLSGIRDYLEDSFHTMERYYLEGGQSFYGIAIPAAELLSLLKKENLGREAESFRENFISHAEQILQNGLNYPPFEVRYEQSIVAPAVSCLIQAYMITGEERFIKEAEAQMEVLCLFNGEQPDYLQYETAIRHWDGKWFGKYRNYGDTYPHYWSALTGMAYVQYARAARDGTYLRKASASFRACLNLFTEDGRGFCAMVYPETVNKKTGHYFDPWANDQDWALYFALKYQEETNHV